MIPVADIPMLAARFQRYGALTQAEQLYRQALQHQPRDAELWSRLGHVCQALGQPDEAILCFRHALDLRPDRAEPHNDIGIALLELGRLEEAVASFHEAIRLRPDCAGAYNNQGTALLGQGKFQEAVACSRQALSLKPDDHAASYSLGNALAAIAEYEEAVACYRRAVELHPEFTQAWLNLASALKALDRCDEAAESYARAAQLRPDDPDPLNELGILLMQRGELAEAVACYERALSLRPDSVAGYNNLGLALLDLNFVEESRLSFEQALYLRPDLAEVHNNLGLTFLNQGRAAEAQPHFEQAIGLQPEYADAHNNLGLALDAQGESDDALASFEHTVRSSPDHFGALTNLGNAYKDHGRVADAIALYRKALALRPDAANVHSNLLLAMQYLPSTDPQELLDESRRYARQHAGLLAGTIKPHPTRPLAGRRLRIGYVSADFREHALSFAFEPALAAHDHRGFEILCYAGVPRPDSTTKRLQAYSDHWRSLVGLSDAQAAELIHQDAIDILVDLDGHTGGNRLLVFARKPAPIQATYLGYRDTTGLPAIDFFITDAHANPPGLTEAYFQERLIRLPGCALCYRAGLAPEISDEPPGRQSGQVTFGCLNNLAKVSDQVLALWSRVLAATPGSRLLLDTRGSHQAGEMRRAALASHGISPERLLLARRTVTRSDYLDLYTPVDICLDPFPYNGSVTTCDALWMGVPVISLSGRTSTSREGVRILRTLGLDELLAESPEDYVRIAVELAADWPRLAVLRSGLRDRMSRSSLMDAVRFARNLEAAYHTMWEESSRKLI